MTLQNNCGHCYGVETVYYATLHPKVSSYCYIQHLFQLLLVLASFLDCSLFTVLEEPVLINRCICITHPLNGCCAQSKYMVFGLRGSIRLQKSPASDQQRQRV